jgi:hypothetical protein
MDLKKLRPTSRNQRNYLPQRKCTIASHTHQDKKTKKDLQKIRYGWITKEKAHVKFPTCKSFTTYNKLSYTSKKYLRHLWTSKRPRKCIKNDAIFMKHKLATIMRKNSFQPYPYTFTPTYQKKILPILSFTIWVYKKFDL